MITNWYPDYDVCRISAFHCTVNVRKRNVRFKIVRFVRNVWKQNKTGLELVLCLTDKTILFRFQTAPKSELFDNQTICQTSEIRTFRFRTLTVYPNKHIRSDIPYSLFLLQMMSNNNFGTISFENRYFNWHNFILMQKIGHFFEITNWQHLPEGGRVSACWRPASGVAERCSPWSCPQRSGWPEKKIRNINLKASLENLSNLYTRLW